MHFDRIGNIADVNVYFTNGSSSDIKYSFIEREILTDLEGL